MTRNGGPQFGAWLTLSDGMSFCRIFSAYFGEFPQSFQKASKKFTGTVETIFRKIAATSRSALCSAWRWSLCAAECGGSTQLQRAD